MQLVLAFVFLLFCVVFFLSTHIIIARNGDDFQRRSSETAVNNISLSFQSACDNYNFISRLIMVNDKVVEFLRMPEATPGSIFDARMGINEVLGVHSGLNYIESVFVIRDDKTYCTTGKSTYLFDIDSPEVERIREAKGSAVIAVNGNGMMKKADGTTYLTLSRAIYDTSSQKRLGLLIMNITADAFESVMNAQQVSAVCITDRKGNVLCGDKGLLEYIDEGFFEKNLFEKRVRINGTKTILCGKSAVEPFSIICYSHKEAENVPDETSFALLLTMVAFLISFFICTAFIARNITRPIHDLDEAMEETKSSGWLKRIEHEMPQNEFGRLAENYNSMIDYLNELFNRLLEEEKNIQKAEMRVLQEQIKPHFLYNTLETISYLAVQENADKAHDALETLGSFYRNFLSKGDREIPLSRELRIVEDYLSLQRLRYGDIFTVEWKLCNEASEIRIPKLILQPLAENCIYHGIRPKGEPCVIRISTELVDDKLKITVYDSGVGMSDADIEDVLLTKRDDDKNMLSGFGLHGTINRIRYFCGSDDVVQIKSELGEYTEITIWIPLNEKI